MREPSESDEMRPQWFAFENIPYTKMWADDILWLPHVLAGKNISGQFDFAGDETTIIDYELEIGRPS
jgi:hypothetical protein